MVFEGFQLTCYHIALIRLLFWGHL